MGVVIFFFFKQKTAYELRISDWSSDVCSSDLIFTEAGFEWREPGCSACLGMNPDKVPSGERCASTSNRNFMGRQGPGARTHLVSPAMAAAAAITGRLTDVRELMGNA